MQSTQNSTQKLNYLASLHYATDIDDVGQLCRSLKSHCNLSGLMIQRVNYSEGQFSSPSCKCFGAYMHFHSQYIDDEIVYQDPFLAVGTDFASEFSWDRTDLFKEHSDSVNHLRNILKMYNMVSGLSYVQPSLSEENVLLAVHVATDTEVLSNEQMDIFQNILPYLVRLSERDWMQQSPKLSKRQLAIAEMLNEGLSARQIASKLNLSRRAVNFHVNRLLETLNAESTDEALQLLESYCAF